VNRLYQLSTDYIWIKDLLILHSILHLNGLDAIILPESHNMHTTSQNTRPRSRTWYRDGFMVTSDASMIDFEHLHAALSGRTPSKTEPQPEECYLVLMTPTPFEHSSSHQIGYVVIQTSPATHQDQALKLVVDHEWNSLDLHEWMTECVKDWLEQWRASDDCDRSA